MTNHDALPTADALDALIAPLLDCGGVLSQIISHMSEFEASGLASPDTPPILKVAHSMIRSVLGDVSERHTEAEIRVSAEIVGQVTTALCDELVLVPPDEISRMRGGSDSGDAHPRRRPSTRRRR
jgi:hypothetical protein